MEPLHIKDLANAVSGKLRGNSDLFVNGVSINSRTINKGEAYFAICGNRFDGHSFIKEAADKGASVIIYSDDKIGSLKSLPNSIATIRVNDTLVSLGKLAKHYIAKFKYTKVVGITGSNGKTTTKEILTSIFNEKGKTVSSKGNFNNRVGLSLSIFNLTSDTKYAVFEIGTSSHGEIKMLSNILKPDAGVITNIGFSHLSTFIFQKFVFKEKKALFDNVKKDGIILVNNDDKFLKTVSKTKTHKIITFALDAKADIYATNISLSSTKTDFDVFYKKNHIKISMPINGRFNVLNALAASACAIGFGFSLVEIKNGIENFTPPKMRMETLITKTGVVLINDAYNANPSSMRESIQTVLLSYPKKKINLVLGDMLELGDKAADYHYELGEFINTQNINSVYLLGEISSNIKNSIEDKKNVFYTKDANVLLRKLKEILINDNTVFLFKASRGMKLEEIYANFYNVINLRR